MNDTFEKTLSSTVFIVLASIFPSLFLNNYKLQSIDRNAKQIVGIVLINKRLLAPNEYTHTTQTHNLTIKTL